MKIVIDIPDEEYENIKKAGGCYYDFGKATFYGTPLPKGHGRLIDADAYIKRGGECGYLDDITVDEFNEITPTIIEADAESEVEE